MSDTPAASPAASPLGDLFTGNAASLAVRPPSWSKQARPLRGLHRWFSGALLLFLVAEILVAVFAAYEIWAINDAESGAGWDDAQFAVYDLVSSLGAGGVGLVNLALYLTCIVLYCRFVYRAMKNLHLSNARGDLMEPAWAAAYAFIPIMNWWKPHQAMRQIWRSSHDARAGALDPPGTMWGWWLLYLVSTWVSNASFRLWTQSGGMGEEITNFELYQTSLWLDVWASAAMVGSILFLRPIIRQITEAQETLSAVSEFET